MTDREAFEVWLEGKPCWGKGKTRREFANEIGVKLSDIAWAFCSGYLQGKQDEREGK